MDIIFVITVSLIISRGRFIAHAWSEKGKKSNTSNYRFGFVREFFVAYLLMIMVSTRCPRMGSDR